MYISSSIKKVEEGDIRIRVRTVDGQRGLSGVEAVLRCFLLSFMLFLPPLAPTFSHREEKKHRKKNPFQALLRIESTGGNWWQERRGRSGRRGDVKEPWRLCVQGIEDSLSSMVPSLFSFLVVSAQEDTKICCLLNSCHNTIIPFRYLSILNQKYLQQVIIVAQYLGTRYLLASRTCANGDTYVFVMFQSISTLCEIAAMITILLQQ